MPSVGIAIDHLMRKIAYGEHCIAFSPKNNNRADLWTLIETKPDFFEKADEYVKVGVEEKYPAYRIKKNKKKTKETENWFLDCYKNFIIIWHVNQVILLSNNKEEMKWISSAAAAAVKAGTLEIPYFHVQYENRVLFVLFA